MLEKFAVWLVGVLEKHHTGGTWPLKNLRCANCLSINLCLPDQNHALTGISLAAGHWHCDCEFDTQALESSTWTRGLRNRAYSN